MELTSKDDFIQEYYSRGQGYCDKVERWNSTLLKQKAGEFLSPGVR